MGLASGNVSILATRGCRLPWRQLEFAHWWWQKVMGHFTPELVVASVCPCRDLGHCCWPISVLFWESGRLSKRFIFKHLLNIGSEESLGLRKYKHASECWWVWWLWVDVVLLYVVITSGKLRNVHIEVNSFVNGTICNNKVFVKSVGSITGVF